MEIAYCAVHSQTGQLTGCKYCDIFAGYVRYSMRSPLCCRLFFLTLPYKIVGISFLYAGVSYRRHFYKHFALALIQHKIVDWFLIHGLYINHRFFNTQVYPHAD